MAALFCMCIKELGHGPLEVNAKSENMITCKTFILSIWYQKFPYLFSRFLKKVSHVHFGLSFLLYLRWDNTTCRQTKDRKIPERVSVFITSSDESAQRATSDENWYEFRDFLVLKWCRHVVLPILLLQNSVKMASQIHCERTENIAQRTLYCNMLDCKIHHSLFL